MRTGWRTLWVLAAVPAVVAVVFLVLHFMSEQSSADAARPVTTLSELLALSPDGLTGVDIARRNLLCAQGLSANQEPDLEGCLATLDMWAERVRSETERHWYRFKLNPAEFENSEGFFRMVMLAVVLAEDFWVKYAPAKMGTAADARLGDGFFRDAEAVFLHGLLGPRREGTCSSLPVLYVAVGRRLGYPLKLVTTKGHLFVRWEDGPSPQPSPHPMGRGSRKSDRAVAGSAQPSADPMGRGSGGERFNVEATGRGVNRFPDEYYRTGRWK